LNANMSAVTRRAHLARMIDARQDPLDVLVVGGGITGAGIALDAAARGYRVGLVERGDFASGTSSKSTKLVHGGIRYLPQLDIGLVREGLHERGRLLRNAPHLVRPLAFILPLYKGSRHPVGIPVAPPFGIGLGAVLDAGLWLYDVLAGRRNIAPHRRLSAEDTAKRTPGMRRAGLKTGFVYYDGQTDDSRLTLAVLGAAAEQGALLANYVAVTRFAMEDGRVVGAYVRETLPVTAGGEGEALIRARHVVNATGVWAEETERLAGAPPALRVAPSKGTHLVFTREALNLGDEAIVLPETEDGRIIFVVPWLSRALVGTTDDEVRRIANPVASEDEIEYLLAHLNRYLQTPVSRAAIVATYAGYRPLLRVGPGDGSRRGSGRLSRTHAIAERPDGLLTISGGKLTAYRRMAEDVVDRIDTREGRSIQHPTRTLRLHGAAGWPRGRFALFTRGRRLGLREREIEHLAGAYGSEAHAILDLIEHDPALRARLVADLPYLRSEVVHAGRAELALTLEDVLARRTHIVIEDRRHGLDAAEDVAALMAAELGWSPTERARQVAAYTAYVREQYVALTQPFDPSPLAAPSDSPIVSEERAAHE
jgi:glycerol-3-phosphate dehydrogenase